MRHLWVNIKAIQRRLRTPRNVDINRLKKLIFDFSIKSIILSKII